MNFKFYHLYQIYKDQSIYILIYDKQTTLMLIIMLRWFDAGLQELLEPLKLDV